MFIYVCITAYKFPRWFSLFWLRDHFCKHERLRSITSSWRILISSLCSLALVLTKESRISSSGINHLSVIRLICVTCVFQLLWSLYYWRDGELCIQCGYGLNQQHFKSKSLHHPSLQAVQNSRIAFYIPRYCLWLKVTSVTYCESNISMTFLIIRTHLSASPPLLPFTAGLCLWARESGVAGYPKVRLHLREQSGDKCQLAENKLF